LVPASINADPNTIAISQEIDNEEQLWVVEPVLEYPEWDYECFHCGTETEEHEGYLRDGECYCDACAYDLFDQPKPKSKYSDEMWENFHNSCQASKEEEEEEEDVWDELAKIVLGDKELEPEHIYKPISRSYCDDHLDIDRHVSRDYHYGLEYGIPEPVRNLPDQLPGSVEELYTFLDKELEKSIIPDDAILIDNDYVHCNTYDEAKEILKRASFRETDVIQDLPDSYIISKNNGTFWFELIENIKDPTKFIISVYAPKDAVAKKYLRRMLEDCVYHMDYLINPEDYQHNEEEEDCATEEDEANFYREQAANQIAEEQNDMAQNDIDVDIEMDNYDTYYTNKALCVTCGEIKNAEPICESEGHSRMVCCDCIEIGYSCSECNIFSLDKLYYNEDQSKQLCFDCKFKQHLCVKQPSPLWAHLYRIVDIQRLEKKHFDILVDYAELAQLTIFDAYRYKSRCHYNNCDRMIPADAWDAEDALQFCCRRHREYAEDDGCHCQNVYDGTYYDNDYEAAICKVCNSPHEVNVEGRLALRDSHKHDGPIVSAICVFNEELKMSNVLAESLVDLCEYFG
jgi:hypothetical protein